MRPMKTQGLVSVQELKQRARRLRALGRISGVDQDYIVVRLDEIEARIISMSETNEKGDEV